MKLQDVTLCVNGDCGWPEHFTGQQVAELTRDGEAFSEMFVAGFERLAEQCGVYIGRMSNEDREFVLTVALELAWSYREDFNPARRSLLSWWDECLRFSVKTRVSWSCRFRGGVRTVSSDELTAPRIYDYE